MCGICGILALDGAPIPPPLLARMNAQLLHRGPDGAGHLQEPPISFAMRRLQIIDLAGSDQPLFNEDGSIALVFNGEIYNYRALRRGLQARGHRLHSAGDGETIVHLYEELGVDALQQLRGMFALALWDRGRGRLLLARDRFGQKPLYYTRAGGFFAFASEIKALLAHPQVPRQSRFQPDAPDALAQYLSYGALAAPATAFQGIHMLEPGSWLQIDRDGQLRQRRYWALDALAPPDYSARAQPIAEEVQAKLDEAVKLRMVSDVPLGALLSGGLDSSLIVALMRRHSNGSIKTFSIGFSGDDSFDETGWARRVAESLGTEHHAFRVQPAAMNLLSDLVWHHDQPFADSSAIPTYLVSKLAREHVTVALTGDGGDEHFVGYERFFAASLQRRMAWLPAWLLRAAALPLQRLPEGTSYYNRAARARRFLRAAALPLSEGYFALVRVASAELLAQLCPDAAPVRFAPQLDRAQPHPIAALVQANMRSYLPDTLLVKADRCSMQASLETRAPFLDHRLAEFAASIPFNLKLRRWRSKHILKLAARDLLPAEVIERRKQGFGIPLGTWLRRDIQPARELLLSQSACQRGLLHIPTVKRLLAQHASGKRDHNRILWALLTLEQWHRRFIDQRPV